MNKTNLFEKLCEFKGLDIELVRRKNEKTRFKVSSGGGWMNGETLKKLIKLAEDNNASFKINHFGYIIITPKGE